MLRSLLWASVLACVALAPAAAAAAAVDSATGVYQDAIPISTPSFHSIAPALSLAYASQGGAGQLGVGWDLSAVSYIERRGEHRGTPRHDATDVWWLDGSELLPCAGLPDATLATSCWAGGNYTTKIESYTRITGDGTGFTVTQKDGTRRDYRSAFGFGGGTARYYLTSVTDSNGNRVDYAYWQDSWAGHPIDFTYWQDPYGSVGADFGNDVYLDTISYNQNVVKLLWEPRPDPGTVAIGGPTAATSTLVKTTQRLRFLQVTVAGATRNGYAIDYARSLATRRSLVTAVTPYGNDMTISCPSTTSCTASGTSLPAMTFAYNNAESHTHGETWMTSVGTWGDNGYAWSGDFNGDGKTDLATAIGANVWVKLSTGTGFAPELLWTSTGGTYWGRPEDCWVGDFDGDGKDDIASGGGDGGSMVKVLLSTGRGFKSAGTWETTGLQAFLMMLGTGSNVHHNTADRSWVGDFNGDGRSDIAAARGGNLYVLISGGDATSGYTFTESIWGSGTQINSNVYVSIDHPSPAGGAELTKAWMGDFNGDGRADIAVFEGAFQTGGALWLYRSTGTSFVREQWLSSLSFPTGLNDELTSTLGDFNGDGKTDLAFSRSMSNSARCTSTGGCGETKVLLSTGTSFAAPAVWMYARWSSIAPLLGQIFAADLDGDGRSDLIMRAKYAGCTDPYDATHVVWSCRSGEQWPEANGMQVFRSTGTGFVPFGYPGEDLWPITGNLDLGFDPSARFVGDFDGDGRTDLAAGFRLDRKLDNDYDRSTGKYKPPEQISVAHSTMGPVNVHLTTPVDTIAALTNGLGATTTFDIVPSTTWRNTNNRSIVPTVRSMTTDDGRGTSATTSYAYSGGYTDLTDGTFTGFARVTATAPILPGEATAPVQVSYFDVKRPDHVARQTASEEWESGTIMSRITVNSYAYSSTLPWRALETQAQTYVYDKTGGNSGTAVSWTSIVTKAFDVYDPTTQVWGPGFGNLSSEIHWGDQNGAQAKTITYQYPTVSRAVTAPFIVGKPAVLTIYAGTTPTTPLSQAVYYYDGATSWATAPTRGNLTQEADWLDKIWANGAIVSANAYVTKSVAYDVYGNVVRTTAPATVDHPGAVVTMVLDPVFHQYPIQTTSAAGLVTTSTWDTVLGVKLSETMGTGTAALTSSFTYDKFGREAQSIAPSGAVATVQRVNEGNPTAGYVQITNGVAGGIQTWSRSYTDGLGRVYSTMHSEAVAGMETCTQTKYNARGLKTSEAKPHSCTAGPAATDWTGYAYDGRNRVTKAIAPDGTTTTTAYDLGVTTVTDPAGHRISRNVNSLGQLVSQTEWQGATPITTSYEYDALGRKFRTTDAQGHVWSVIFDSLGRVLSETRPDTGTVKTQYDSTDRPTLVINALGEQTSAVYDVLGRMVKKTNADGATTFAYSEPRPGYFNEGKLTSYADPAGQSATLDYDQGGNLAVSTRTVANVTYTDLSFFDAYGRLQWRVYPDGEWLVGKTYWFPVPSQQFPFKQQWMPIVLPIAYDAAGRVQTLDVVPMAVRAGIPVSRRPTTTAPILKSVGYDLAGRPTTINLGNGTTTSYAYDPARDWMSSMQVALGGTRLQLLNYAHTPEGQVSDATGYDSAAAPTYAWTYGYDELHRLTSATDSITPANNQTFAYDAIGNLTSNSRVGAYVYGDPAHPHAVTRAGNLTYTYDAAGRMTNRAGGKLTWDADGRLASTATMTFTYDAIGNRVRANGTTSTVYLGDDYEITAGVATKIVSAGVPLAKRRANVTTFLHTDRLGSVTLETDAAGAVTARPTYRPYGEPIADARTGTLGYTGQRQDESGLLYLHARYYDPALGRFASPDPTLPTNRLIGLNAYAYAANNPLSNTDIDGLGWFDWVLTGLSAVAGPQLRLVLSFVSVARNIIQHGFEAGVAAGIQSTVMDAFTPAGESSGNMGIDAAMNFGTGFIMNVYAGQPVKEALRSAAASTAITLGGSLLKGSYASTGEAPPSGQEAEHGGSTGGASATSGSSGQTCFIAGTPITMSDGSTRAIESIEVGEYVLAYDVATGLTTAARVTETFVHRNEGPTILVNGLLQATPNHPFFANGAWVRADALALGDTLMQLPPEHAGLVATSATPSTLGSLASVPGGQLVYNLEVDTHHDYFAGGVLVHNKPQGGDGDGDPKPKPKMWSQSHTVNFVTYTSYGFGEQPKGVSPQEFNRELGATFLNIAVFFLPPARAAEGVYLCGSRILALVSRGAMEVSRTSKGLTGKGKRLSIPEARRAVLKGRDVYAGSKKAAAEIAGGNRVGPEVHMRPGETTFMHFHPAQRIGFGEKAGHIFFGPGTKW